MLYLPLLDICVKTGSQKKRDWFRPVSMKVLKVLDISPVMVNTYLGICTYLSYLRLMCSDNLARLKSGNHAHIKQAQCRQLSRYVLNVDQRLELFAGW